jgi:ABC-2 type transport system ATP-binding protein
MDAVIEIREVSKSFQGQSVLERCSLNLQKGEIYGLLGVNGAGKTTLMKITGGFQQPDEGEARIDGRDSWEHREKIRSRIGSLIETPIFYEHLSARENLEIHMAYMGQNGDITGALEQVGLSRTGRKPVAKFSMGMKQRLGIARAMLHNPDCLLLDEPINGLDPVGIQEVRDILLALAERGTAILISSHILSEMEQLAHRVGILAQGKIVEEFSPSMMRAQYGEDFEKYVIDIMRRKQV